MTIDIKAMLLRVVGQVFNEKFAVVVIISEGGSWLHGVQVSNRFGIGRTARIRASYERVNVFILSARRTERRRDARCCGRPVVEPCVLPYFVRSNRHSLVAEPSSLVTVMTEVRFPPEGWVTVTVA